MGLDMYLVKTKRVAGLDYHEAMPKAWDLLPITTSREVPAQPYLQEGVLEEKIGAGAAALLEGFSLKKIEGSKGTLYMIYPYTEVGYWRKANAIHHWFVVNVQYGEDDCRYYEVTREHLLALEEKVELALEAFKAKNFTDCEYHLPTQGGFFFGSTDYDDWYETALQDTLLVVQNALNQTDWENDILLYQSSW